MRNLIQNFAYRIEEKFWDWRWRIRTYDYFSREDLGLGAEGCDYSPVPFRLLRFLLAQLPQDLKRGALMDFGCGMGRVLVAAHEAGFVRAVGVELSPKLCAIARANAGSRAIEVVEGDAALCPIPNDVSTFFSHNPFLGGTLGRVLDNIEAHAQACGRECRVVVSVRRNFDAAAVGRAGWRRLRAGTFPHPPQDWAVYQVGPGAGMAPTERKPGP